MSDKVTLIIPSKPEYLLTARLTGSSVASRMGFDINDIEDIKTATAESLLIMMHQQATKDIEITFVNSLESLEITVRGILGDAPKKTSDSGDSSLSKYLIEALADGLEFDEEGGQINKIRFSKKFQR